MPVTDLQLRWFSAFTEINLSFASGINIFIGENGTGKSHVMRAIYATLRAAAQLQAKDESAVSVVAGELGERFARVFCPADDVLAHLINHGKPEGSSASVFVKADTGETMFSIDEDNEHRPQEAVTVGSHAWSSVPESLFLPAHEVLSMFEGFISFYKKHQVSYDESVYDLCLALEQPPLRDQSTGLVGQLRERLELLLGGTVHRDGSRFYVDLGTGKRLEAHLVAEGLLKIAGLVQLMANGSISKGGVLFWDEPESNLNPRLITRLAGVLSELAKQGVQLFVSTHDYLLSRELAAASGVNVRLFSFYRDEASKEIHVETGTALHDISNNPIVDEYVRQYERELERFADEGDEP